MAELPRLSPKAEHRVVKVMCGLPVPLQRLLFGKPRALDGQVLASEIQTLIRLTEMTGSTSITDGAATPEQARALTREGTAVVNGPPLPVGRVEDLEIPGPAGSIPARLYVPNGEAAGPSPLLVYYHGGGWVIGDLDSHDGVCRFFATYAGVRVLSVDYRLAPEHPFPAAVEDSLAAFDWAAEQAGQLGIDPARIAVGGDSAGGNLAAAISLLTRDAGGATPAMQLLIYPATDVIGDQPSRSTFAEGFVLTKDDMEWFEARYLPDGAAEDDPRVSMLHVKDLAGLPPAYVVTAGFDPLRDEGEAYAERMREAGVKVAVRRHPGLVHSFANLTAISRTSRAAMLEAAGALHMGLG